MFFYKERKRTQRMFCSFEKNTKECENAVFFWKERMPNPADWFFVLPANFRLVPYPSRKILLRSSYVYCHQMPRMFLYPVTVCLSMILIYSRIHLLIGLSSQQQFWLDLNWTWWPWFVIYPYIKSSVVVLLSLTLFLLHPSAQDVFQIRMFKTFSANICLTTT